MLVYLRDGSAEIIERPSNMPVYLNDGSAQKIARAATLRLKLQMKLSASSIDSKLRPAQHVPARTL